MQKVLSEKVQLWQRGFYFCVCVCGWGFFLFCFFCFVFKFVFFSWWGKGGSKNHYKRAFRWRADDGPTLNAGLVAAIFQGTRTCIARKPYIFVIFHGGSGPPGPPSGSAHDFFTCLALISLFIWSIFALCMAVDCLPLPAARDIFLPLGVINPDESGDWDNVSSL